MKGVNYHFPVERPAGSLLGLWKVRADGRYCPSHEGGLDCHGLFLTYGGEGQIFLEGRSRAIRLPAGSCFPIKRGSPCRYGKSPEAGIWSFYFLEFRFPDVLEENSCPWERPRPSGDRYRSLCEGFIDEAVWNRPGRDGILEMGLLEILNGLIRADDSPPAGLEPVLRWMHSHTDAVCHPDDMVKLSGMGRTQFFRRFRERTGRSPLGYFQSLKAEAVKSLLEMTDLSLSEIAYRLHYCDEYYLSRQFRKETGMSPRRWQKQRRYGGEKINLREESP